MVLTNAVYFKGFWKYSFKPQSTHKEEFYTSPKKSVQVDMMSQIGKFKFGKAWKFLLYRKHVQSGFVAVNLHVSLCCGFFFSYLKYY